MIEWGIIALIICGLYVYIFEIPNYQSFRKVTRLTRGNKTERSLVRQLLKHGIPYQTIFHDLYLKKHNTTYSQIDVVIATKVGIIVFEVKRYSGWLFGTGNQRQWTQVLNYGKEKHRFYNPILQNKNHIRYLKTQLPNENVPFFSVVVFYGDCVLKDINYIPNGTYLAKSNKVLIVLETILREHEPALYTDKRNIINLLTKAVKNGEDTEIQKRHVQNIKDTLGEDRIFQ